MLCRPGHATAPAGPTPPAGPCVWRLIKLRCAPATVRLCVTHIRTVAGLLPGAQLGIVTAAAPSICQPSSTASTVAILAQGTKWADALPQAFFQTAAWRCRWRWPRPRCRRWHWRWHWRWRCVGVGLGLGVGVGVGVGIGVAWRRVAWRGVARRRGGSH